MAGSGYWPVTAYKSAGSIRWSVITVLTHGIPRHGLLLFAKIVPGILLWALMATVSTGWILREPLYTWPVHKGYRAPMFFRCARIARETFGLTQTEVDWIGSSNRSLTCWRAVWLFNPYARTFSEAFGSESIMVASITGPRG